MILVIFISVSIGSLGNLRESISIPGKLGNENNSQNKNGLMKKCQMSPVVKQRVNTNPTSIEGLHL